MTIEYLDSKRIKGTAEDRTGAPAVSGGWKELGRTTLGSGNTNINVASIPDKRYYMILRNTLGRGGGHGTNGGYIINNDSGSNYAVSRSGNGGNWADNANFSDLDLWDANSPQILGVDYMVNKSDKEKLLIGYVNDGNTAGAGNAPMRAKIAGKWANTSDAINRIDLDTMNTTTWNSGSEVVVLGWDPDDTHTTNFWEELASVELSSASDTLSSGTITAKKYLWFQYFIKGNASGRQKIQFNGDTGSNYSYRYSGNGAADSVANTDTPNINATYAYANNNKFGNFFVVNNSANEKLLTGVSLESIAGAGNAPNRTEVVGKWDTTGSQITNIAVWADGGGSAYNTGSFIKVWGSN